MVSKPKGPDPLDVGKVASEQASQNTTNLWQQQAFNRPNQTNQYGSTLGWQQTGTDARGNPIFAQTHNLGAQGQQFAGGFAGLGQQYIQGAGDFVGSRPDMSSNAAFDRAYGFATANLEPRFERASAGLDTKLRNQGLEPGSEGYKNAMNDLALQQNEARNDLVNRTQSTLFNQGLQDRAQRQSEFGLLNPGVQYGGNTITGGFANVPGLQVPNIDLTSLYGQQNADAWRKYQSDLQGYNSMVGGLAGLGGTIAGGLIGGPMGAMIGGSLAGGAAGGGFGAPPGARY